MNQPWQQVPAPRQPAPHRTLRSLRLIASLFFLFSLSPIFRLLAARTGGGGSRRVSPAHEIQALRGPMAADGGEFGSFRVVASGVPLCFMAAFALDAAEPAWNPAAIK